MEKRTGEKIGWVGGWIGAFIWVAILSILFFYQEKLLQGVLGFALTAMALSSIGFLTPWRFPETPYWKLMLVPYSFFLLSFLWAFWAFGGCEASGLAWWNFSWVLALLVPFIILGKRKWSD